jgi:hypothetical protein
VSERLAEIGPNDPRVQAIAKLIAEDLAEEARQGLPTLRRIPSTGTIKFLDYFATLTPGDCTLLVEALAQLAALHFFPMPLIAKAHEQVRTTHPACLRLSHALQSPAFSYGLRYCDLRMHRMMVNDAQSVAQMTATRATLDFAPRDDLPEPLVGRTSIRDIQTAKAPLLRKLLNPMLLKRLSTKPEKRPGGELVYDGSIDGMPLRVSIIFSNLYAQMHYAVSWPIRERPLLAKRLTYEALWGANTGWDYLTEGNAPPSIDLLDDLLVRLANLFHRIADLPTSA